MNNVLPCGHPGESKHLIDGKCGTCRFADELDAESKTAINPNLKEKLKMLSNAFRSGKVLYDTNGKTLSEFAKEFTKTK